MVIKCNKTFVRRRAAGLCIRCGKVPSVRVFCDECRASDNARIAKLRNERRAAGICFLCDAKVTKGKFCHKCREHVNSGQRRRYFDKTTAAE